MFSPVSTLTSIEFRPTIRVARRRTTWRLLVVSILLSYIIINMEDEEREERVEVKVNELAYKKIVYHLVRYPTAKVTGVLTGRQDFKVTDAYPLFHTPIVNPTFSVALDLIESNLPEGQRILGFYEFVECNEFKIGRMVENNPNMKNMISMRVFMDSEKNIKMGSAKFTFDVPAFSSVQNGLKKREYAFLVDMDAHLQEIQLDFRNGYLQ